MCVTTETDERTSDGACLSDGQGDLIETADGPRGSRPLFALQGEGRLERRGEAALTEDSLPAARRAVARRRPARSARWQWLKAACAKTP